MRLTRFNKLTNEYEYHLFNPNTSMVEDEIAGTQKLGQLEDIEEELGIELIKLLKDIHSPLDFMKKFAISKAWTFAEYVGKNRKLADKKTLQKCECCWYEAGDRITFMTKDGWHFNREISDYGKTWALTREELEDGKKIR